MSKINYLYSYFCKIKIFCLIGVIFYLVHFFSIPSFSQILWLNRSNSGFVDDYINKIILYNGLPVVCTESGLTIVHADSLETWRRGTSDFPDAGIRAACIFQGKLWIGTNGKGLAKLESGNWRVVNTTNSGLIDNFITTLETWGTSMYIGTRDGLCKFDGFLWERIPLVTNKPKFVTAIAPSRDTIWVGTKEEVFRIESGNKVVAVDIGLSPARVSSIKILGDTTFIGSENGLAIFTGSKKITLNVDRIPGSRVYDMVVADNGVIIGTSNGLAYVTVDGQVEKIELEGMDRFSGFPVTTLAHGTGFLWIGFEGGGIARFPDTFRRIPIVALIPQQQQQQPLEDIRPLSFPEVKAEVTGVRIFSPPEISYIPKPQIAPLNEPVSLKRVNIDLLNTESQSVIEAETEKRQLPKTVSENISSLETKNINMEAANNLLDSKKAKPQSVSTFLSTVQPWPVLTPIPPNWKQISVEPIKSGQGLPAPVADAPNRELVNWKKVSLDNRRSNEMSYSSNLDHTNTQPSPSILPPGWKVVSTPSTSSSSKPDNQLLVKSSDFADLSNSSTLNQVSVISQPQMGTKKLSFQHDILPIVRQRCLSCHTTGSGSDFFPIADTQRLLVYFQTGGFPRFEAATFPGRGMAGVVSVEDLRLIREWVSQGAIP